MIKLFKYLAFFTTLIASTQSCSNKNYTSSKYFNCDNTKFDQFQNDSTQIIYEILLHACVNSKDIPDFVLLRDQKKIYVANLFFKSSFSDQDTINYKQHSNLYAIPLNIGAVSFCLKSFTELSDIADKKGDFVYIQLGHMTINNDKASIGISTNWMLPSNSKRLVLSGGGYIADFQKIDGKWTFIKKHNEWIS